MSYSWSVSSSEFLELRIQPMLFKHIWNLKKKTLIRSKSRIYKFTAIFYFILQSYSTGTQFRIDRPKIRNKNFIKLLFHFGLDSDPEQ